MTGQELYEHVRELAREGDVTVFVCATCDDRWGLSYRDERVVYLSLSPDEPVPYFTALHELGHQADGRRRALRLDREAFAWQWAIEHALIPPAAEVWAWIHESLTSYAANRRYRHTPDFLALLETVKERANVQHD